MYLSGSSKPHPLLGVYCDRFHQPSDVQGPRFRFEIGGARPLIGQCMASTRARCIADHRECRLERNANPELGRLTSMHSTCTVQCTSSADDASPPWRGPRRGRMLLHVLELWLSRLWLWFWFWVRFWLRRATSHASTGPSWPNFSLR